MPIPRVFISHYTTEETQQSFQILTQLIADLRTAGAEVVTNGGRSSVEHFTYTLNHELPQCQWLLLIQTPEALHSSQVQTTVNTAIQLVSQQHMQGIIRLATSPVNTQEIPMAWSALTTIDIGQDYPRALEKVLLALGISGPITNTRLQAAPPPAPPFAMSPTYDRPPVSSSRFAPLAATAAFIEDIKSGHASRQQRLLLVLVASLLLVTILGTTLFAFLHPSSPTASNHPIVHPPAVTVFGHAYFLSSGLLNANNTQGLNDEIQLDLNNLTPPTTGNAYYVWLLSDKNNFDEATTRLLGTLTLHGNAAHLKYTNPSHTNLLANGSRLLVTEESASVPPISPSPEKSASRYYAEIPQVPNPTDTVDHYSDLDHLRHLLVNDPTLLKLNLPGGLNVWFFQNVQKVHEWATAAQGDTKDPQLIHSLLVRILDYLDGSNYVQRDVPPGTPILVDPQIARVALLTTDPENQQPPGYVSHLGKHLGALIGSPYSTQQQNTLAGKIDAELNKVNASLLLVQKDTRQLVHMTDTQLLAQTAVPLLDDLVTQADNAYIGRVNASTGNRDGGAVWIYDHIQQLAVLTITKFSA
ncbi:MAG TPA: hypothetical protein VFU49_12565 [Ktedonobacteraceae bacterium]|nr:hypothetical protein [Ktedonobacteraceae bacterium]